ncbi:hypothetical protein [Bradyrhizobium sp. 143]|uniref:hypothetical protein n=1 Tax=Bradyrhizobium sp. 143 TaxID=2782619 RepID=UPI003209A1E5
MEVYLQAGLTARAGINATGFAGAGGEAAPGTLDGDYGFLNAFMCGHHNAGALIADMTELGILTARSKPFLACWVNRNTMLVIRSLQPGGRAPSQIERVTVTRPATGENGYDGPGIMADPPYRSMIQAAMSAKFTSISALLGKPVTELRYIRESFGDRDVEEITKKTSLLVTESDADGIKVEVHLKDGRTLTMHSADVPDMSWDTDIEVRF